MNKLEEEIRAHFVFFTCPGCGIKRDEIKHKPECPHRRCNVSRIADLKI